MTPLSEPRTRITTVTNSSTYNGIDFVEVVTPRLLHVHFLNAVAIEDPSLTVTIDGGDSIPTVPLKAINNATDWATDSDGHLQLTLNALADGDFSFYRLTITAPKLDIYFNRTTFSFKAACPSDFDCAPASRPCPADDTPTPPIDYLAKDFLSFRQALTEYSSLRYPNWAERSEADFGMMMAELLSALGDELSYLQDRVAAEATLPTATQRRSLVSIARLVDYEPQPAISATTTLLCTVPTKAPLGSGTVPAGTRVSALAPDGSPVPFEIGKGLADETAYPVSDKLNFGNIVPYWFDDSQQCWPAGSTDLWVRGHGFNLTPGTALLIQTDLPGESLRQVVTLTAPGVETVDPIFLTGGAPTPITHILWGTADALTRARDLISTTLGANLLPATQGQRFSESFAIGSAPPTAPDAVLAIARMGPNGSDSAPNYVFRYPLANGPLGWLAQSDPTQRPLPELDLKQLLPAVSDWTFVTSLLKSLASDTSFTIDPVAWRAIARRLTGQPTQYDIDGDDGSTIRFGDGVFGSAPAEQDLFSVTYRTGLGATGNVAAETITIIDPNGAGVLTAARNPFAVTDGADAETADHIRRMAPQAFQAVQYRAVLATDYEAAAESLAWVEKAGTSFRWTGSWMTVFTAVDPHASDTIGVAEHLALFELLDRRRLACYESYAPAPQYLSLDLRIEVCVDEGWLGSDVEAAVLDRLGSATRADDSVGFFFADRFTFGAPLYRSRLEAAIQGVPGVAGVSAIAYRQRGTFAGFVDLPEVVAPAPTQILRVDNDPSWPERGTIRVIPEGGR
jgi:hypothetical protein